MVGKLIQWATNSPVVVLLLVAVLVAVGGYAFFNVNVEAYPDPAPAIIEVVAQWPGASAEEIERQVTIPIEVALAGMPGLKYTRAKSMFGLAHLRNQFEYSVDYERAKQEVINRLQNAKGNLPKDVDPSISPASPIGEILRYTLSNPKDALGRPLYTLNDLKALQDWTLVREFRRVPRVAGVVSSGGTVKRYEIHPDPERLKEYDITLDQLQDAIAQSNANVGGDYIVQGPSIQVVRGIGLIGGGEDPMQKAMAMKTPAEAAAHLRSEELRRIYEIRRIVIASTNNVPIRVEHVVDGGPVRPGELLGERGVVVGNQTRQGQLGISRCKLDEEGEELRDQQGRRIWYNEDDQVQGIILLYKGQQSIPALIDVKAKIDELNNSPGRLLPGVQIEPFYNRETLIDITTETVHENLLVGILLVTMILLMFLSNVRAALIVAINIPLALLFAFAVLYLRGKSANLLSIGAVDFGIIVDSSVIMVENIYRRLSSSEYSAGGVSLRERIVRASREVERSLFFSTIIMICAMLPLFTMKGPEGQIFGPMADTYAFALAGALLLALTVSPVFCMFLFKNLKPARDNVLVRNLKRVVVRQLNWVLHHRWASVLFFLALAVGTVAALPYLGREFMPELEEGNLVVRGTFPVNVSLQEVVEKARIARRIMSQYEEVRLVTAQVGRPDDGTDPTGYYNVECFVPLKLPDEWPIPPGHARKRNKAELIHQMNEDLTRELVGINWDFSQMIRDNVLESLSGVKGENSVKIIGPDLNELEKYATLFDAELAKVPGVFDPGIFHIRGQSNLAFPVDREKCALWSVSVADLEDVIQTAVGGKPFTDMIEGEKTFDVTLRWPPALRENVDEILNIPVDVVKNNVTSGPVTSLAGTPFTGASTGLSSTGTSLAMPSLTGNVFNATSNNVARVPRRRLGDLVTPVNDLGFPDSHGSFVRPGASQISREQGKRLIPVKFGVRGRDLASTVADAQKATAPILAGTPYTAVWSGEFQQMQEAEQRMASIVLVSLVLILVLLYLAFRSLLDALVVFANVAVMSMGGVWTLFITGINFNVSAAVGFISILGVAVMNGLLLVSSFNQLRAHAVPLHEALEQGAANRIRPLTMTALTAILGLLPAAMSTKIGAQSQRPLAIVVVGGMITTLVMFNLVPLLYSFYGDREPPEGAGDFEH
ncbi:MAG TPA: efflux RND transporter permease subunit [Pirellulales bacterium]|jgi:cobalt-zinc-cadmium resistance protein CzcA|nr:efflux RND transporter permease subunit [Pirellulales bacterium]